jgi:putative copper resistance protein D
MFVLLVLRPGASGDAARGGRLSATAWSLVAFGAALAAVAQVLSLAVALAALGPDAPWRLQDLVATSFFGASVANICVTALLASMAFIARGTPPLDAWRWGIVLASSLAMIASAAWTSHAVARGENRAALMTLDALHQLGAAIWTGGLVHLVAMFRADARRIPVGVLRRFSLLASGAVVLLIAAGVGLTAAYTDGLQSLFGTAYGVMVMTKITLLAGVLALGGANFMAVRRLSQTVAAPPDRLRRFVEVELGLGITILFAAASLTSLPPAIDVTSDRATLAEVASRFTPHMPRLTSPSIDQLPVDDPLAERTAADRAWSEYNHHMSGLFVLAMGLLATLYVSGHAPWARHWPLVLLGLAGFMFVRNDPGAWPLGPQGFWASMMQPSVLEHRLFVVLVVLLGIFEWRVRVGRIRRPGAALVFPLLCAVGGGLLLAHSHASLNIKTEFLLEVTHAPLGVLGIVVGWARWLELRSSAPEARVARRVWAFGLAVFGVVLLLYRES